jgi:hypothetical protein
MPVEVGALRFGVPPLGGAARKPPKGGTPNRILERALGPEATAPSTSPAPHKSYKSYTSHKSLYPALCFGLLAAALLALSGCKPSAENATAPATNAAGAAPRVTVRTNAAAALRPGIRTNALPAAPGRPVARTNTPPPGPRTARVGAPTNAPGTARIASGTNAPTAAQGLAGTFRRLQTNPAFYPVVIFAAVCLLALIVFLLAKKKAPKADQATAAAQPAKGPARPSTKLRRVTINSCNVLQVVADTRQLWQFEARGGSFVLGRQHTARAGESLPGGVIAKSWRTLWQSKLNVAWVPPEHVFLRVVQLPVSSFDETLAMVELQLEKLSPIAVGQIVWSIQVVPQAKGNLQTVIVMIVARDVVEEFLGKLEGQGYLADRLELPLLDQLQATNITEDGVWIYPETAGGQNAALAAWWCNGVLQNLDLLTLPAANRAASLKEQLMQMAWAGELEGWLTTPPRWHLVSDPVTAAEWEPVLREGLEQSVTTHAALNPPEVAALTARRAALSGTNASLLPAEFATRYQQQFVDRLWMRGLLAVGGLYVAGVAIYLIAVGFATYRTTKVENYVAELGPTYTNAIQLKARYDVLKGREALKYAGLDCWNTTAKLIPQDVTLDSLNFGDGRRLSLNGTAPADHVQQLLDFEAAMRKFALPNDQPLFDREKGENLAYHVSGAIVSWNFSLELKQPEAQ